MPDERIECCDCKTTFIWTEGEQTYYKDKGLALPKRCYACRLKRRTSIGKFSTEIKDNLPTKKKEVKKELEDKKPPVVEKKPKLKK
jgi:hypothetical protein